MAQMNISIPSMLKAYVETRVASGDYASTSDYLRDLVRRDREREIAREDLRAEIRAGFDSPISDTDSFEHFEQLRKHIRSRADTRDAA